MTVQNLMERTVECLKAHGYEPWWINHSHHGGGEHTEKTIDVEETFRMNHRNMDNVTVTISITKWGEKFGKRVFSIKVPKDASDRVIENRVQKVIKAYEEA